MNTGRLIAGGSALCAGVGLAAAARKALRTGRVPLGDKTLASVITRAEQPSVFWLAVVFLLTCAVVVGAAGVLGVIFAWEG